jgi:hypothetical protein
MNPPRSSSGALQQTLWELRQQHVWSATLGIQRESDAWETLIRRDGEPVMSDRFLCREQAACWAYELREFIRRGWAENGQL